MAAFLTVPSMFRDPVVLTFVDEDNRQLAQLKNPALIPRVGENVRLAGRPHVVLRVGYDVQVAEITAVWVVCRAA